MTRHTAASILREVGGSSVKQFRLILVVFLLGTVVCVSAGPRIDLPETAFNEADAPVTLAPPLRPGISIIAPAVDPVVVGAATVFHSADYVAERLLHAPATLPFQRHRVSLQHLLCTFLI